VRCSPCAVVLLVAAAAAAACTSGSGTRGTGPDAGTAPFSARHPGFGGPIRSPEGPELHAIAAVGPDDIWAVGDETHPATPPQSFVLHFDGSSWQQVRVPDVHGLIDVAAISASNVWLIGHDRASALHFDGSAWSKVTLPAVAGMQLSAVSGSGSDNVWIVGTRDGAKLPANSIGNHTLALHWDGHIWSVVPTPNPDRRYNWLNSVLAQSLGSAWAVGSTSTRSISIHWDGTAWKLVPTPLLPGHHSSNLAGVGSDGNGTLWAVGQDGGIGYGAALYLRWDGQSWQPVPGPQNTGESTTPSALSGTSPRSLWAVGSVAGDRYMIARFSKGRWQNMTVRLPDGVKQWEANLTDVLTLSSSNAWAVGRAAYIPTTPDDVQHLAALLLHWDGHTWAASTFPSMPTR
jgi:hypothetical protein